MTAPAHEERVTIAGPGLRVDALRRPGRNAVTGAEEELYAVSVQAVVPAGAGDWLALTPLGLWLSWSRMTLAPWRGMIEAMTPPREGDR